MLKWVAVAQFSAHLVLQCQTVLRNRNSGQYSKDVGGDQQSKLRSLVIEVCWPWKKEKEDNQS